MIPLVLSSIEVIDRRIAAGNCRKVRAGGAIILTNGQYTTGGKAFDGRGRGTTSCQVLNRSGGHYELAAGRDPLPYHQGH